MVYFLVTDLSCCAVCFAAATYFIIDETASSNRNSCICNFILDLLYADFYFLTVVSLPALGLGQYSVKLF